MGTIIVVPCFNEAKRLDLEDFVRKSRDLDVDFLFVDDGSSDGTDRLISQRITEGSNKISLIVCPSNNGKAEAVRIGILEGLKRQPNYIGYWDADRSTPLDAIRDLREVMEQRPLIEVVMGSRVKILGHQIYRRLARHYFGRVVATLVSIVLRTEIYDTQCGAKLFRCHPRLIELFDRPFDSRWLFDVEILLRIQRQSHLKLENIVQEYPLPVWRDVPQSKVHWTDFFVALIAIACFEFKYNRGAMMLPSRLRAKLQSSR